jgi:hypothetical protein
MIRVHIFLRNTEFNCGFALYLGEEVLCFIKKFKRNLKHNFHIHDYNTRGNIDLDTQSYNKTLLQKSFANMGAKLYNRLLERIKILNDHKSFKKDVKFLVLNNSCCTINEFLQFYRS